MAGLAHRQPEEIPFDPSRSAHVNGFCRSGCCLFSFIAGAGVTAGGDAGMSHTKEVDTLPFVSQRRRAGKHASWCTGLTYAVSTLVDVATVLVIVVDPMYSVATVAVAVVLSLVSVLSRVSKMYRSTVHSTEHVVLHLLSGRHRDRRSINNGGGSVTLRYSLRVRCPVIISIAPHCHYSVVNRTMSQSLSRPWSTW
jgi:hypothetical protein